MNDVNIHNDIRDVVDDLVADYFPLIFGGTDSIEALRKFGPFNVKQSQILVSYKSKMSFEC